MSGRNHIFSCSSPCNTTCISNISSFWNIYISFHDVSLITILNEWEYVGWTNFIDLFNDPNFYTSLKVTIMFVGGSVALQFGIGLLISILLHQQVRVSGVLRAIFIIPWTISAVIAAFSFKFIFR